MLMDFRKYYPPGYDYKKEWSLAALLFLIGAGIGFHGFFEAMIQAENRLYTYRYGDRGLIEGAIVKPFAALMEEYWVFFAPLLIFIVAMMVYHYFYYYHETKSIYVMRRLPRRSIIVKSCVQGPLLTMLAGAVAALLLYLLCFGLYMMVMPSECMPRFV